MKLPLKTSIAGLMVTSAIVAVSLVTVPSNGTHADSPASAPPPPSVSVAVVENSRAAVWDEFSGRLEAIERVDVRPRVAGAVHRIHFREGALVKQGALLVTIDPAPYAAEVDRLEAQVAAAESRVQFTKMEVERGRRLLGTSALSERDVDQRTNAYREADANLRAAKAALQTARLNLEWTDVRAPVAGRVGRLEITTGNVIAAGPGAPVLTTIVSVDPIYAGFNADETVIARALASLSREAHANGNVGAISVEIASSAMDGGWTRGSLQLIDNQIDAGSGTVRTRAVFDNADGRLIPGQFVRVRMARPVNGPVVAVSERAVGTDQNKRFVLVVDDGNKTAYREVNLGAMAGNLRIVTAGLSSGERIIINGLQRVRPGDVVTPEITSMDGRRTTAAHADQSPSRIAQH